jgi:uncharacterized protein (TIGR02147 family)
MDICGYTDYQAWIKDSLEELKKKKPFASLRYVGNKTGIDPGNLVRVMQGKVHLGEKAATALGEFLNLNEKQQAYLRELIVLAKAKNDKEAWASYNRLHALKGVKVRSLEDHEFKFFQEWHYIVIRSLLNVVKIKNDYRALSKMLVPNISIQKVKESITLLKKLDMIYRDHDGYWKTNEQFLGTGKKWKGRSVQNYQIQNLNLAIKAIDAVTPGLRDISTVTINIPHKELPVFKSRIREFRNEIMGIAKGLSGDDSVYQLNVSFFPSGFSEPHGTA